MGFVRKKITLLHLCLLTSLLYHTTFNKMDKAERMLVYFYAN